MKKYVLTKKVRKNRFFLKRISIVFILLEKNMQMMHLFGCPNNHEQSEKHTQKNR